jgi:hypothetical protein
MIEKFIICRQTPVPEHGGGWEMPNLTDPFYSFSDKTTALKKLEELPYKEEYSLWEVIAAPDDSLQLRRCSLSADPAVIKEETDSPLNQSKIPSTPTVQRNWPEQTDNSSKRPVRQISCFQKIFGRRLWFLIQIINQSRKFSENV